MKRINNCTRKTHKKKKIIEKNIIFVQSCFPGSWIKLELLPIIGEMEEEGEEDEGEVEMVEVLVFRYFAPISESRK